MQGGGELPWEVTCRGVVDGIAMVIHMTRHEGRRFAEEAVFVKGYEARNNQWDIQRITVEGLDPAPVTQGGSCSRTAGATPSTSFRCRSGL